MSTTIVDVGGVDLRSAPLLERDCSFPITNLERYCPADGVVQNMPIHLGFWEDGTEAPSVLDHEHTIDTTGIVDECDAAIVNTALTECSLIAPNMQEITLKTARLKWKDLKVAFCRQRSILPGQLCVFNPDGSLAAGEPYTIDFVRFSMKALAQALRELITRATMVGDEANTFEFDGFYTQLQNGWDPGANACPDDRNIETAIDWAVLTGDPHGTGIAFPDDETIAGQTVTIWGTVYPVPVGINLAQFLEDLWIHKIEMEWTANFGGVTMWEMHVPYGASRCFLNTAACMQPCDISGEFDQGLRERFAQMRNSDIAELYPSGTSFPILETTYMPANTLRFGPREVGGRPTYGLFFEPYSQTLDEMMPYTDTYGQRFGYGDDENEFLLQETRDYLARDFENQSIYWSVEKEGLCVEAFLAANVGFLACSRHLWLRVDNIGCESLLDVCGDTITVV